MGKNAAVVVISLIIIAAVVVTVVRLGGGTSSRERQVRAAAQAATVEVIDAKTLTKVTVKAGDLAGMKTDPKTGYKIDSQGRLLATIHKCASCGADIPSVPVPIPRPGERPFQEYRQQIYMCPVCKKPAYPEGLRPESEKMPRPEGFTE